MNVVKEYLEEHEEGAPAQGEPHAVLRRNDICI